MLLHFCKILRKSYPGFWRLIIDSTYAADCGETLTKTIFFYQSYEQNDLYAQRFFCMKHQSNT